LRGRIVDDPIILDDVGHKVMEGRLMQTRPQSWGVDTFARASGTRGSFGVVVHQIRGMWAPRCQMLVGSAKVAREFFLLGRDSETKTG
jgi:hypothetical protein